ncbi:AAA family ATPase [Marinobacter sp. M1N3S26]|uniref:AAA family ATPase n=1 Tax=Marinobacter sp. M1N3S26 TaxID=3382299 RepID=UPI00387AD365
MDTNDHPIIKNFKIIGLHGYKDVVIDFDSPVRIVIAENGAGKTTILSALHSFLTCKFHNLRAIDFEEMRCVFYNLDEEIVLKKKNLENFSSVGIEAIENILQFSDSDEESIVAYITTEFDADDMSSVRRSAIGQELFANSPWHWDTIHELFSEALEQFDSSIDTETRAVAKNIKHAIGDIEILYLPTYRRIEKLFEKDKARNSRKRGLALSRRRIGHSPAIRSQMNYGLSDVEDRLAALTEDVQRRTNTGYREISANIIDDLLAGKAKRSKPDFSELPELETLKLFFSRIGGSKPMGDSYFDRIQKIYEKKDYDDGGDRDTLMYFLSKLSQVVNQTKQLESTIENFVSKANTYLGSTSDVKTFNYDPESMRIAVINKWTSDEVKLNDLSSGEKQVVSLLSYLFLYPSNKIILVDEPELSLSIDWQQRILVDMVAAPSCKQLLAITHSPFIFDNELDSYGAPLKITRKAKVKE